MANHKQTFLRQYDDVGALLRLVENIQPEPWRVSMDDHRDENWDLGVGFSGALKLAEEGWVDGVEEVRRARERLGALVRPRTHQQDFEMREDGGSFVDVGTYCSGEPECFGNFKPPERPVKPIKVVVGTSYSWTFTSAEITRRGALIVALIDALEELGYMVECHMESANTGHDYGAGVHCVRALLKATNQSVDVDRLAFWITHPAARRRIGFAVNEQEPRNVRQLFGYGCGGSYYGTPTSLPQEGDDLHFASLLASDPVTANWKDDDRAVRYMRQLLVEKGYAQPDDLADDKEHGFF